MEEKQIKDIFQNSFDNCLKLLESLGEGVQVCELAFNDKEEAIDYILHGYNKLFEQILNLTRRNVLDKKVTEFTPELASKEYLSNYEKAVKSGNAVSFETYSISMDKWLGATVLPLKEENWFAVIFKDITKDKKAEIALKESKEKYQDLIETTSDLIWEADNKGLFTYCSPQIEKLWGIKPQNIIGKTVFIRMPDSVKEEMLLLFNKLNDNPKPFNGLEVPSYDSKGRLIFVEINGVPFFDAKGRLLGWRGITRNITERKKAEEEVKRLASFPILNPNPVIEVDFEGKVEYANPTAKAKFANLKALGLKHPLFADWKRMVKLFREKTANTFVSEVKIGDDWYLQHCFNVPKAQRIRMYVLNITERKKTEEQLEKYRDHLERLVDERTKQLKDAERLAAIGATAGMVGHDIRNPLQAITGDLYLLKSELELTLESDQKKNSLESIQEIERNIDYINKIVADLQDYSKPLNPSIEKADIKGIIEELLSKTSAPENIKVSINVEPDARSIVADSTFINRIMYNLVNNAVQAMPNGGSLTIHAYKDENYFVISVKDTGVGIPKEIKNKLFTPMFTTKAKGQGFGLPVVKRMTEALNGTVSFDSQEGKGTTFTLRLPAK